MTFYLKTIKIIEMTTQCSIVENGELEVLFIFNKLYLEFLLLTPGKIKNFNFSI